MRQSRPWPPERVAQWKRIRSQGRNRFIWTHGVLEWGGFMFCFSLAVFQHRHYGNLFSSEGNLPFRVILAMLVWTFVGYLYGRSRWQRNEQEFLEQQNDGLGPR